MRSPLDNIQFSAGVYWKLGNGDGIGAQKRQVRAEQRLQSKREKRAEKEFFSNLDERMDQWQAEEVELFAAEEESSKEITTAQIQEINRRMSGFNKQLIGIEAPKLKISDIPVSETFAR